MKVRYDNYLILKNITKNVSLIWKNIHEFSPENVALKMDDAQLEFLSELTDYLKVWLDKGRNMNKCDLFFARINLGTIVESWLRFFFCVYYNDYIKKPIIIRKKILEPENGLTFSNLIEYSIGILWDDKNDKLYKFVEETRKKRNAVHSFLDKDLGTVNDFIYDIDKLYLLVDKIYNFLPPIEDYIDVIPYGYVQNVYFKWE